MAIDSSHHHTLLILSLNLGTKFFQCVKHHQSQLRKITKNSTGYLSYTFFGGEGMIFYFLSGLDMDLSCTKINSVKTTILKIKVWNKKK